MNFLELEKWKTLPGPENIFRVELENGITILTRQNFNSPSVVVQGYLESGSQFDPIDKLGLAHFTALALMRGTTEHDFQTIFNDLESAGASLGFSAGTHTVGFGGMALAEDLGLIMSYLQECLRQPVFPGDQVEKLKIQLLASLAIRAQETSDQASINFDKLLFGDHPYGQPEDGFPETIQTIQREDLSEFHRGRFGPNGMVIVVVGAVETQQAVDVVLQCFGDWNNPQQQKPPQLPLIQPLKDMIRKHIPLAEKTQTDLVMGTLGPRRSSPDYLAASLGNSVLGQFGMMGRIGDVVREQAGLAYHASTSLNSGLESGSWEVNAGVNPANLDRAINLILGELGRFVKEPVTSEELDDSKANYIGRMPLSLESNAGMANALSRLERFRLGLDYYQRFPGLVARVNSNDILETARRYIDPTKQVIVSSGPDLEE
jgi:zinc protease